MATAPTEWVELASPPADDRQSRSRREFVEPRARRPGFRSGIILVLAMTPALAAIWTVPWFVTQDGPAHVYNAQILARSFDPGSPFRDVYTIRWQPIPNWIGHLALAGLVAVVPPWVADRILISLTLAGFAGAVFWLRGRVAGAASDWGGLAGGSPGHEHHLAVRILRLLAGRLPVPDHPGILVAASRRPVPAGSWDCRRCWSSATSATS